jgi:Synergist-CTERM protein sorting domain-containing protein
LTAKTTGAAITRANQGRNDENIDAISVTINVQFQMIPDPVPEDPEAYFNGIRHGTLVAPAIRLRAADLGLNVTVGNSTNISVSGNHHTAPDADQLVKALKVYNEYNSRFGILDGYTGEIKVNKPDIMNGGTYSRSFKLPTATSDVTSTLDGRMITIGGWGGRGTLHGFNERVELDGMVDFVKRCARVFVELAGGVPHTWTVTGNGSAALPHKKRLAYAASNDNVAGIYLKEEAEVRPIIAKLYANNVIPREEITEILFARKFRMNGLTAPAGNGMTLETTLTDADGAKKGSGKIYMFAREAANPGLSNVNSTWTKVAESTANNGVAAANFNINSIYNTLAATGATSADVEVSVIAVVVTNGASKPLSLNADTEEGNAQNSGSAGGDSSGCNAGFAALVLMSLPFIVMRRR